MSTGGPGRPRHAEGVSAHAQQLSQLPKAVAPRPESRPLGFGLQAFLLVCPWPGPSVVASARALQLIPGRIWCSRGFCAVPRLGKVNGGQTSELQAGCPLEQS